MSCRAFRPLTTALLLVPAVVSMAAADRGAESASDLAAALEAARRSDSVPFHLQAHQADANGPRSLEVFPSSVGIWSRDTQVELPAAVRRSLLAILQEHDFASLAPSYGGKGTSEVEEAPLRVTCRVRLEIDGLEKSSVQLAEGEQSARLAALADALLDLVEPLAADGVTAENLEDGLRKLARGRLAAEAFALRLVWLPASGEGEILSIRDGRESRRAYAPGRRIGEARVSELSSERLASVATALLEAQVTALPVNLWSPDHVELEVAVLGHQMVVIGRDFSRLASDGASVERKRFDRLVAFLQAPAKD